MFYFEAKCLEHGRTFNKMQGANAVENTIPDF